ncbi:MAG: DUF6356 family protein [Rickettsiales bacterium]|nr:DUF6356 family protein [Rickettsiales bacterium]
MIKKSRQHLTDTGEAYFHHQRFALRYGLSCFAAGIMALIHGLIPAFFQTTASEKVTELANRKRAKH